MSKTKSPWKEIRNDYTDSAEGLTYIDAWTSPDDDEDGRTIATIDLDGNVTYKDERAKTDKGAQEAIREILNRNEDKKQELVDAVYNQIKKDLEEGDGTVLESLLKEIATTSLLQSLPENNWKDFPEAEEVTQEKISKHQRKNK
jgi:hypothetical protein